MSDLLVKTGTLVCLEFPSYKDPLIQGPPWGVREDVYVQHLSNPGEAVEYGEDGFIIAHQTQRHSNAGLVRKARWMPERTHDVGKGTDFISLWAHVN
jgi:methyl halide transferase